MIPIVEISSNICTMKYRHQRQQTNTSDDRCTTMFPSKMHNDSKENSTKRGFEIYHRLPFVHRGNTSEYICEDRKNYNWDSKRKFDECGTMVLKVGVGRRAQMFRRFVASDLDKSFRGEENGRWGGSFLAIEPWPKSFAHAGVGGQSRGSLLDGQVRFERRPRGLPGGSNSRMRSRHCEQRASQEQAQGKWKKPQISKNLPTCVKKKR